MTNEWMSLPKIGGTAHEADAASQPATSPLSTFSSSLANSALGSSSLGNASLGSSSTSPLPTPPAKRRGLRSKETAIGLTVIGVLSASFGTLLFRKLTTSDSSTPPPQVAELAPTGLPPQVVPPTQDAPVASRRDTMKESSLDNDAGPPSRSFMPADEPAASRDRYANYTEPAGEEPERATPAGRADPFRRSPTREVAAAADDDIPPAEDVAPRRIDIDSADAQPLASQRNEPTRARAYPVQPTAGQVSLGEEPEATEAAPLANEAPADNVEPAATPEDADASGATTPTVAVPSANDSRDFGPEEDAPMVEVSPRYTTPAEPEQPAAPSRWQSAEPVAPASNAEPMRPENGKYTVGPNDTLWSISEKVYGTGGYFKALYEFNRNALPHADRLTVGSVLAVPPAETLAQNYPTLCPKPRKSALVRSRTMPASSGGRKVSNGNVYVVAEGDTLFDIARYELGKASRWAEIYELNRDTLGEDFDYLQPGTELNMPPRARATESFTRQPADGSRR